MSLNQSMEQPVRILSGSLCSVNPLVKERKRRPRPANGFLGFCHRHRVIVSQQNPSYENRLVTKILGQWWKSLKPEEKKVYEDKAKTYKTEFMAANPDYKWYTRPESSGNTPVTRLSNRRGNKLEGATIPAGAITPGKLADVSQMGGLSSLMSSNEPSKKRGLELAAQYIAEEHDYLESKPSTLNNNNIAMRNFQLQQQEPLKSDEEANNYSVQGMEIDSNGGIEGQGDQKSACDDENHNVADDADTIVSPNFEEFMKACPVYCYDTYLKRRAEGSAANQRALAKKNKWRLARLGYSDGDASQTAQEALLIAPVRRRRKRRAVGPTRNQKKPRLEPQLEIPVAGEPRLLSTPPNNLDLLAMAAETIEKNHRKQ